jgi:hypothetical protein
VVAREKCVQKVVGKPEGKSSPEKTGRRILKKLDGRVSRGLKWLRIGSSGWPS